MTEYQLNLILTDVANNLATEDYTDRELNEDRSKVTCFCSVTSQITGDLYPRYTITWKTSKEKGYIQAAYHFRAGNTSFARIAKIYPEDEGHLATQKIENALKSGLKRGKAIYDGKILGPWSPDYVEPSSNPESGENPDL